MKNITLPQALVLIACLAAPIAAYKLLDSAMAAGIVGSVGMLINFIMGRDDPPPPPAGPSDASKVIGFVAMLCLCLAACFGMPEAKDPRDEALDDCIAKARADYYVGEMSVEEALARFEACKRDAGI
jgi:hypothetical protein